MVSLKKKIAISILICMSILLGGISGLFLQNKVKADDNKNYVLTVEKVSGYKNENEFVYTDFDYFVSTKYSENKTYYTLVGENYVEATNVTSDNFVSGTYYERKHHVIQSIEDDNIFMLNNANVETDGEHTIKEYLHVKFTPIEGATFMTLNVQVKLKNLDGIYNVHSLDLTTTDIKTNYDHFFDLDNTYNLTSTSDTLSPENKLNEFDAQGLYTFDFSYWITNTDGSVDGFETSTEFYLLNQRYYVNPNDDVTPRKNNFNNNLDINNTFTEPRFSNTERIDRERYNEDTYPIEQNYFNFTNQYTTDYFGNQTQLGTLLYPTLRFDATRYYATWSRTTSGVTTTFEAVLNTSGAYPKLVVTEKNVSGVIIGTSEITDIAVFEQELVDDGSRYYVDGKKTYTQYIANIEFTEIGEYTFNFHHVFAGEVLQVTNAKLEIEKDAWKIVGSDKLTIFGYKLEHSVYKNEISSLNSEMKYVTYEEINNNDFDAFRNYELVNNFYVLTLDNAAKEDKTYYKRNYLMADVTNMNIAGDSILGQTINKNSDTIYDLFGYVKTTDTSFVAGKTYYEASEFAETTDTNFDATKIYYEKNDDDKYVISTDEAFAEGKTYYEATAYKKTTDENFDSFKTYFEATLDADKLKLQEKYPTTNQAPVSFDYSAQLIDKDQQNSFYYHFIKTGNIYTLNGDKNEIRNDTAFDENGLYIVVLTYGNSIYQYINSSDALVMGSARKVQVFAFEIANVEPDINITDENDVEILKTSGYTNQNVTIDWSSATKSPFDVKPYVRILRDADYNGNQVDITNTLDANAYNNGTITVTQNGRYYVRVDFGPCTYALNGDAYEFIYSASITYTFVIDKNAINGIEFYNITNEYNKINQTPMLTRNPFAIVFGDSIVADDNIVTGNGRKTSGAKITATYEFMPINLTTDLNRITPIENGNELYVANNKSITLKNVDISYEQAVVTKSMDLTGKSILSNDGIYIFHFVDEAGNETIKYLFKDTTNPVLLQRNGGDYSVIPSVSADIDNIVNTDTEIVFGTHKAILLGDEIYSEELANEFNLFDNGNEKYILIGINNVYENAPNNEYSIDKISSEKIVIFYRNNGRYMKSQYATSTNKNYIISAVDENEHLFTINIHDKLGNGFSGKVEMNFDKSLLMAYISGSPEQNSQIIGVDGRLETIGDGTQTRLNDGYVSNKKSLNVSWNKGGEEDDDFEVASVIAEFYPLTFEQYKVYDEDHPENNVINENYPYSATPYQIFDLMQNTTPETVNGVKRLRSAAINLVQDARYGEYATVEGMYHIVRTYTDSTQKDGIRHYYFYVDRNNLISYNENFNGHYIGNQIKMVIGDATNEYTFAGSEFLQEFVTQYILQTNKQPASVSVPNYKYDFNGNSELNLDNSKIGINQLRYKIVDEQGNIITKLENNSVYTIKIYDNSSNSFDNINDTAENYTSLTFMFSVDKFNPVASFVDTETGLTMTVANQNSNLSTNNTNVKLVWDNIAQNDLQAMIDKENIQIDMVLENGTKSTIFKMTNGTISVNRANVSNLIETNGDECFINLNKFNNFINKRNCRFEITLRYQSQDGELYYGEYLYSTKIIFFDFEKPKSNFNNLIQNDAYLHNILENLDNFEDYNSIISFDNYAFTVSSDWKLKTPAASSFWQYGIENATANPNDVQTVWYRTYNKYADESGTNAQSIIPGDDRYDNSTAAPTRYMFRPNMIVNGRQVYTQITSSLENFSFSQFSDEYIEIIEMDCAGNYRIYTIYVPEINSGTINYTKEGDTGTISDNLYITDDSKTFEISNKNLVINQIKNIGPWYTIQVLNGSTNTSLLVANVAPKEIEGFVTINEALEMVNDLIGVTNENGCYYIIKITSSLYGDIAVHYHTPGQRYELQLDIYAGRLEVTIDQNKYGKVTYVTSLKVFEMVENNGSIEKVQLSTDNDGKTIKPRYELDDENIVYKFSYNNQNVRNLVFEYVDNFGQAYKIVQLLGITQTPFEEMISFNGNYIENEDFNVKTFNNVEIYKSTEYYTNSNDVVMIYQPMIYGDITIYRNGDTYDFETVDIPSKNIKQVQIFSDLDMFGEDNVYIITFNDTSERNYLFVVHHYLKTADIKFIDTSDGLHDFDPTSDTYQSSVSRIIYMQYETVDTDVLYPIRTNVNVTRTYYDKNNIKLVQDYGNVTSPFEFVDYGIYTITTTNSLETVKKYSFEFIKSDATYYTVVAEGDNRTIILAPSEVPYYYNYLGQNIDHYVSIYKTTIDVNQQRDLDYEEITDKNDDSILTRIYRIFSNENSSLQYEKYIAITRITKTSNIGSGRIYLNGDIISGSNKYLRTNTDGVTLTLPSYFENESNLIKVSVKYGNKDLGIVNTYNEEDMINISFKTAGVYYIYISDLAGNQHSFDATINWPYYTLALVNDFVYNLNGEQGIVNSIFNEAVEFTVVNTDEFVRDGNGNKFTLSATLNGVPYSPSNTKGSYIFSDYGTYFVTLKGYINSISDENLVTTTAKFSILNPKEAKFMHEYIGLNGYEVTKIERDGNDITDEIREALNSATINKFAVYGGHDAIGGNGNYTITVLAHIDDIVGDREFTYSVKINKDTDILILCSLAEGDQTTGTITLEMNLAQIYNKIGESKIKINGNDLIVINEESANAIVKRNLTANQRYNVTLETNSGNTILSFVVTKVEPLNSVAIIVIVVVGVVVTGLVVTFILLRKRMKVR